MKLLIDGTIYQGRFKSGISRIFTETLPRICDLDPEVNVDLFTTKHLRQDVPKHARIKHSKNYIYDRRLEAQSIIKNLIEVKIKRDYAQQEDMIWHSTYYTRLDGWKGKTVVTVADMIHERFPYLFDSPMHDKFRKTKARCIEEADKVVCISETTKNDLERFCDIDPEKIVVIPLACSDVFNVIAPSKNTFKFKKNEPYLLYVGARTNHKSFNNFLEAYASWSGNDKVGLVLVGKQWMFGEEKRFRDRGIHHRIQLLTDINDYKLCEVYNNASAFIFPSLYEGFGIPLLEAMKCGCPIIASNIPSTVEIAGKCPILYEPDNCADLIQSFDQAIYEGRKSSRIKDGFKRADAYSWDKTAVKLLEVYKAIGGGCGRNKSDRVVRQEETLAPLTVLQVNSVDVSGGAAKVAWELFTQLRKKGNKSLLAVGFKKSSDQDVYSILKNQLETAWSRVFLFWGRILRRLPLGRKKWIVKLLCETAMLGLDEETKNNCVGLEDFPFPESGEILNLVPNKPDVVNFHVLHGGYFDLSYLPEISKEVPVVVSMHDAWLLSGHCAHSFGCERWKTGCGECPDLLCYPGIWKDDTHAKWKKKKKVYANSKIYVTAPSNWLMDNVKKSILMPGIIEERVINHGVDLSKFFPANKARMRQKMGFDHDSKILVFTANGIRRNIFKDYRTLRQTVSMLAEKCEKQKILFIALGEKSPVEKIGQAEIRFIPYKKDPRDVADYYRIADLYVHAARAETWGLTITEALACGVPVVASAVGGIPEQIKGLKCVMSGVHQDIVSLNKYDISEATGILVPPQDAQSMAECIMTLLDSEEICKQLGVNGAEEACRRFDIKRQINEYMDWYREIVLDNTKSN